MFSNKLKISRNGYTEIIRADQTIKTIMDWEKEGIFVKAGWLWKNNHVHLIQVITKKENITFYFKVKDYDLRLIISKQGHFHKYNWNCTCNHGSVMQPVYSDIPCCHIISAITALTIKAAYKELRLKQCSKNT